MEGMRLASLMAGMWAFGRSGIVYMEATRISIRYRVKTWHKQYNFGRVTLKYFLF